MEDKVEPVTHTVITSLKLDGELKITCSCGCVWSHQVGTSEEKIESIYQSHLAYFNKPKITVL